MHIHTHTYTYIHIHIHTHTYTYIHIHTHTSRPTSAATPSVTFMEEGAEREHESGGGCEEGSSHETSYETSPSPQRGGHRSSLDPGEEGRTALRTATWDGRGTVGGGLAGEERGRQLRGARRSKGAGRHIQWSLEENKSSVEENKSSIEESPPRAGAGKGGEIGRGSGEESESRESDDGSAGGWEVEDVEEQAEMLLRGVDEAAAGGFLFLARDRLALARVTLRLGANEAKGGKGDARDSARRRRLSAKIAEYDARLGVGDALLASPLSPHELRSTGRAEAGREALEEGGGERHEEEEEEEGEGGGEEKAGTRGEMAATSPYGNLLLEPSPGFRRQRQRESFTTARAGEEGAGRQGGGGGGWRC